MNQNLTQTNPLTASIAHVLAQLSPRDQAAAVGDMMAAVAPYLPAKGREAPAESAPAVVEAEEVDESDEVEAEEESSVGVEMESDGKEWKSVEIQSLIDRLDPEQRIVARALARGDRRVGDLAAEVSRTTRTLNNWLKEGQPMAELGMVRKGDGWLGWTNPVKVPLR